jgi:hypothetical protein
MNFFLHKSLMSGCQGDGSCMTQVTQTRYSNNSCPYKCQVIECHNFKMCGQKRPQRLLDCHNSMCMDCAINYGKLKFLSEKEDCPICFLNKDNIELRCTHKLCLGCWKEWSKKSEAPVSCPLCRKKIWS